MTEDSDRYPRHCPKCNADLRGEPIPANQRRYFSGTHFWRVVGLELPGYDGVSAWECPDCKHQWSRFDTKKNPHRLTEIQGDK